MSAHPCVLLECGRGMVFKFGKDSIKVGVWEWSKVSVCIRVCLLALPASCGLHELKQNT